MAKEPDNPKSVLQERLQEDGITPTYRLVETQGPPHDRTFVTQVFVGVQSLAKGVGRTKKESESHAAESALEALSSFFDAKDSKDKKRKAADPQAKLIFLCNPHNPAGRAWTAEELTRLGEICLRHGVTVISDEIHCDLTLDGHRHIPFASLNEEFLRHSVTCTAPSKTFNIAGLQAANIIAADPEIRRKIDRQLVDNELHALNAFAVEALIAAYNEGGEWLDELKKYLWENYEYLRDFFTRHLPALPVTPLEATYLVWVDCRTLKRPTTEIARQLLEEGHVWINEGEMYAGEGFLRINIACPRKTLAEGLERIRKVVG